MLQKEYIALGKHCREIAVGFLENCRTSDEVSLLLSQPHDILHDVTHVGRYPRLRLALDYEQKEVRSSPQQTISPLVLCDICVVVSVSVKHNSSKIGVHHIRTPGVAAAVYVSISFYHHWQIPFKDSSANEIAHEECGRPWVRWYNLYDFSRVTCNV